MPLYRTGLLIIRACGKEFAQAGASAIRATTDVSKGFDTELTVTDVPSASAQVETWLGDVMAAGKSEDEERKDKKEKIYDNLGIQRLD